MEFGLLEVVTRFKLGWKCCVARLRRRATWWVNGKGWRKRSPGSADLPLAGAMFAWIALDNLHMVVLRRDVSSEHYHAVTSEGAMTIYSCVHNAQFFLNWSGLCMLNVFFVQMLYVWPLLEFQGQTSAGVHVSYPGLRGPLKMCPNASRDYPCNYTSTHVTTHVTNVWNHWSCSKQHCWATCLLLGSGIVIKRTAVFIHLYIL